MYHGSSLLTKKMNAKYMKYRKQGEEATKRSSCCQLRLLWLGGNGLAYL